MWVAAHFSPTQQLGPSALKPNQNRSAKRVSRAWASLLRVSAHVGPTPQLGPSAFKSNQTTQAKALTKPGFVCCGWKPPRQPHALTWAFGLQVQAKSNCSGRRTSKAFKPHQIVQANAIHCSAAVRPSQSIVLQQKPTRRHHFHSGSIACTAAEVRAKTMDS